VFANECALPEATHLKLQIRKSGAPKKDRKIIAMEGFGQPHSVLSFQSTIHNISLAIIKRVLTRKIPLWYNDIGEDEQLFWHGREGDSHVVGTEEFVPRRGEFSKAMLFVFHRFTRLLSADSAPIAYEDFIGKYSGLKKQNYIDAWEVVKRTGFTPRHAHIRAFIKFEKDCRELKPLRVPRVISPAGFVYLLETGVYIRAVEEKIYAAINTLFGYVVVAKGMNYDEVANVTVDNWRHFKYPAFIDLDVEKLDASVFPEALLWTHYVVCLCFPFSERKKIMRLLSYQLRSVVKGRASDGYFSYKINGTLTSGQMNTSLVGVLLVTSILYPICSKYRIRLLNMGDDCRLIMDKHIVNMVEKMLHAEFAKFRMFITVQTGDDLYRTEFCQTKLIETSLGLRAVRLLAPCISKDSICIDDIRAPHKLAAWMLAVGTGGLATHGGIPVFDAFYRCMVRNAKNYLSSSKLSSRQRRRVAQFTLKKKFIDWSEGLDYSKSVLGDHFTRVGFYKTFDMTVSDQEHIEGYYDKLVFSFDSPISRDILMSPIRCLY
jgi:hypothetical protein